MAAKVESATVIEGRRKRRFVALGIIIAVAAIGNVVDVLGWVPWGPGLDDPNQRGWVLASAGMFWVVFSMFLLCLRDLASVLKHRSRPPKLEDLIEARRREGLQATVDTGRISRLWNWAGKLVNDHVALVGLIGLIVGALLGHIFWGVGGY